MRTDWPGDHAAILRACERLHSPGLLVFPDLVRSNIARMIAHTGSPDRLRPHLKTTKMPQVVRLLLEAGITQFKCATLAEMRMALESGVTDILLAYQAVGPNLTGLVSLAQAFPDASLSTLVDTETAARELAEHCRTEGTALGVYIDIDCGMHRTGMAPGEQALALMRFLRRQPSLSFHGWHVYDGHLRQTEVGERRAAADTCFQPVWAMLNQIDEPKISVIAGGTPSFPLHAKDPRVICSPGTCVFWDAGYASIVPDMEFDWAALLLTRVISKNGDHLTLDLGHKAVSAENPIEQRVVLPAIPDAQFVGQSEEHLVVRSCEAANWQIGDALLGIPWHICPSVALYDHATTITGVGVGETWDIPARRRYHA